MNDTTEDIEQQTEKDDLIVDADAIRADVEAIDVGDFPTTDEDRILCRYMRARMMLTMEAQRITDQMTAMLRDLENRLKGLDWVYGQQVEQIVRAKLAGQKAKKKVKSIKTPWGSAGLKTQPPRMTIVDAQRLLQHALIFAPQLVETETMQHVPFAKAQEWLEKNGELLDGCEMTEEGEKFWVK